ncbi:hypothetical protein SRHO_G00261890 [Serrasalmus rhombeus]
MLFPPSLEACSDRGDNGNNINFGHTGGDADMRTQVSSSGCRCRSSNSNSLNRCLISGLHHGHVLLQIIQLECEITALKDVKDRLDKQRTILEAEEQLEQSHHQLATEWYIARLS